MTIILPDGYEWVGAALAASGWLVAIQSLIVSKHRKRSGIKYPQLYAEKAEAEASHTAKVFNCAQRAHQNTLENMPMIIATTLVSGVSYPLTAAALCALFVVGRISYTLGYLTGDPAKRITPLYAAGTMSGYVNLTLSTFVAGQWIYSKYFK